jgi:hypothetical protein
MYTILYIPVRGRSRIPAVLTLERAGLAVAVKQVLNGEGVPVTDVASYLCFGREMWSKTQKYAGETMAKEAAVLVEKWKGRSLSQAVLEAIRSQAFSVNPPTPG